VKIGLSRSMPASLGVAAGAAARPCCLTFIRFLIGRIIAFKSLPA
jgi:hypothetical protein